MMMSSKTKGQRIQDGLAVVINIKDFFNKSEAKAEKGGDLGWIFDIGALITHRPLSNLLALLIIEPGPLTLIRPAATSCFIHVQIKLSTPMFTN